MKSLLRLLILALLVFAGYSAFSTESGSLHATVVMPRPCAPTGPGGACAK
jgi:hypothetical protein